MAAKLVPFGGVELALRKGWEDITSQLEATDGPAPPTLARSVDGNGALQLSVAWYYEGDHPEFDVEALQELLTEFQSTHGLLPPEDVRADAEPRPVVSGRFRVPDGSTIALWYVTNGDDIAFFTYVCEGPPSPYELAEADAMVRSVRFPRDLKS